MILLCVFSISSKAILSLISNPCHSTRQTRGAVVFYKAVAEILPVEPDAVNTDAGKSTFFVSAALSAHSQLTRRILPMLPFYISIFLWIYLSTKLGLPLMTSPNQTPKADPKADSLKTPAHRSPKDARFEEEARDLTRTLPASKRCMCKAHALTYKYRCEKLR